MRATILIIYILIYMLLVDSTRYQVCHAHL